MPMDASVLPGAERAPSFALVISWNRVDFPLEANPIRAALSMRTPDGTSPPIDDCRPPLDVDLGTCVKAIDRALSRKTIKWRKYGVNY